MEHNSFFQFSLVELPKNYAELGHARDAYICQMQITNIAERWKCWLNSQKKLAEMLAHLNKFYRRHSFSCASMRWLRKWPVGQPTKGRGVFSPKTSWWVFQTCLSPTKLKSRHWTQWLMFSLEFKIVQNTPPEPKTTPLIKRCFFAQPPWLLPPPWLCPSYPSEILSWGAQTCRSDKRHRTFKRNTAKTGHPANVLSPCQAALRQAKVPHFGISTFAKAGRGKTCSLRINYKHVAKLHSMQRRQEVEHCVIILHLSYARYQWYQIQYINIYSINKSYQT